jgi:hypothetical protein
MEAQNATRSNLAAAHGCLAAGRLLTVGMLHTLGLLWSMILSENRYTHFGIMLSKPQRPA